MPRGWGLRSHPRSLQKVYIHPAHYEMDAGVEQCVNYEYGDLRPGGWAAEGRALSKEADKQAKAAVKVCVCVDAMRCFCGSKD